MTTYDSNSPSPEESIKHLCKLNFSIFTQKLQELQGENKPKDKHGIIRKKWLRIIRNEMKTDSLQTLISYLYAAKSHIHRNQSLTRNFFKIWRSATSKANKREQWKRLIYLAKIRQYRIRAIKIRDCRVDLAVNYILDQPRFKRPNFNLFVHQIQDVEIDKPPINPEAQSPIALAEREIKLEENENNTNSNEDQIPNDEQNSNENRDIQKVEPTSEKVDLSKKINFKNLFIAMFICVSLAIITYYTYRFFYKKLGYYDKYKQSQFNETMPPSSPTDDVDCVINYSDILSKDKSIDDILNKMSKEIASMKMRQTEMKDQIDQLQNAYLNE